MEYLAHISEDLKRVQSLEDHLQQTAALASTFASAFGDGPSLYVAGLVHDIGKYPQGWQNYLKRSSGYDLNISPSICERGTHSTAGAAWLLTNMQQPDALYLAYVILGHHAGLPDFYQGSGDSLTARLFEDEYLKANLLDGIDCTALRLPEFVSPSKIIKQMSNEYIHLGVRLIFSCLVDADYIDTERFMDNKITLARGKRASITELKDKFDKFMAHKNTTVQQTPVNKIRKEIYEQCVEASMGAPGFYSLTVPTGGGKTLSAMAFALNHAVEHKKSRVIMAIPYTSIIEQTAKVYKYGTDDDDKIQEMKGKGESLFGEENVLEHHSNVDPEKELYMNFLASQNWDVPVVVTTNVQLFESLLAAKPSRCRKLHNLVNSIIILDEAQKIPAEYLRPILSVLKGLVEHFGVTVLFCTATQPALCGEIGSFATAIEGVENCTEIIQDTIGLYNDLKRVEYVIYQNDINKKASWQEIAEELQKSRQVLCIVNKRKDCRELMKYMPGDTIQLSGLMCGQEISMLISQVKRLLAEGKQVRVVSTQLVEAGVDIDFPEVWRAIAQLDSIAQAAGRANREGMLKAADGSTRPGKLVIFNPDSEPFGEIKIGAQLTTTLAGKKDYFNRISSRSFASYFKQFYAAHGSLDKCNYDMLLVDEAESGRMQFRSFAEEFKLIDTAGQKTVFVQFDDGIKLISKLRQGHPDRKLMSALQRYTVNIPERLFFDINKQGGIEVVSNYYVLHPAFYQPGKGVLMDDLFHYDEHQYIN